MSARLLPAKVTISIAVPNFQFAPARSSSVRMEKYLFYSCDALFYITTGNGCVNCRQCRLRGRVALTQFFRIFNFNLSLLENSDFTIRWRENYLSRLDICRRQFVTTSEFQFENFRKNPHCFNLLALLFRVYTRRCIYSFIYEMTHIEYRPSKLSNNRYSL